MKKREIENMEIVKNVIDLLENARKKVVVAVNQTMVQILSDEFKLSWSHYVKLSRISNPDERKFYEIEAVKNNWSLRELV